MMATLEERLGIAPSERERILRATAEICAERGYRGTSVAAILERADCSEESFYRKFDGVEDCTAAAPGLIRSQVLAELSQASSPDLSEPESGLRAVKAILELMAANPSLAYLNYVGARQMAAPRLGELYWSSRQLLAMMIERFWGFSKLEWQPRLAPSAALGAAEAVLRRELLAAS